ncbi:trans-sulfuration enzyme family protein [Saccharothrix obliqua]|uniref:trans-sulfuration enzyme family protein n=1 Tax=Saccharothrix obliqua TaxID=2861747 RepID=UPI001C602658|nr:PLP-dependent aspartate aminotransferase family protein [Saccharothrix obliqua]MBW4722026.1 PLP-dependent aspartate aminotransferase family protein [Saccharothrix obliqua]
MRFDTKLVHVGQEPPAGTGDLVPPLHLASTYERDVQDPVRWFYARGENPTREDLERVLAALEDVRFATAFASGQAAGATALAVLARRLVIVSDDVYGGTHALMGTVADRGVEVRYADLADPGVADRVLAAAPPGALVWVETPTNPLLKVVDVARVARQAHEAGAVVLVDNTVAGPALQRPLALGADVSLYSTTKSVAGHLDVLGGALVHDREDLHEAFTAHRTAVGSVPGPFDCFLVHRGLKTLSLRAERQVATTGKLVAELCASPAVAEVRYPGLPGHPGHEVAARQMSGGGSLVSFRYRGDVGAFLRRLRLFGNAVSLGGVRSLASRPATTTHRPVPPDLRARLGITEDLVRMSIGIEDPEDLLDDLRNALGGGAAWRS